MDVIWGPKAKHSYFDELDRIHEFNTVKEVKEFINLVENVILNIRTGVLEGKVSRATEINSLVISKQTTLFFGLDKNNSRLELLLFWRNKEDPKKLVKLLKGFQTE
jgi:hypothetical protein